MCTLQRDRLVTSERGGWSVGFRRWFVAQSQQSGILGVVGRRAPTAAIGETPHPLPRVGLVFGIPRVCRSRADRYSARQRRS